MRNRRWCSFHFMALLVAVGLLPVQAQEPYKIQPGDVLNILVLGEEQLSRTITVLPDGTISYFYLRTFKVQGMTVAELEEKIVQALSRDFKNPIVTVNVTPRERPQVFIIGEVVRGGAVEFVEGLSLAEYLAKVGGPTPRALLERVTITRRASPVVEKTMTVNLKDELIPKPGSTGTVLMPGDIVFVPPREEKVYVWGEVKNAGAFEYRPELRLSDYLGQAGGLTTKAWLQEVKLFKAGGREAIKIDLSPLQRGESPPDITIEPGDTLLVPSMIQKVYVYGAVSEPGAFDYQPELNVNSYIGLAGGTTERAWRQRARIKRVNGQELELDLDAPDAQAMKVEPFDSIFVPVVEKVYVTGEVKTPGAYDWREGRRIADYIDEAGGVTTQAWLEETVLTQPSAISHQPSAKKVNLKAILFEGKTELNLELQPGDHLYIPRRLQFVNVSGELVKPGQYEFREGWTVQSYLGEAGGATEFALLSEAMLISGSGKGVRKLNLEEGQEGLSFVPEPGDTILVPKSQLKVNVVGAVKSPGAITYRKGLRLTDYIALAGGHAPEANLEKVTVHREGGRKGVVKVNLKKALAGKSEKHNLVLMPGDVVNVPERGIYRWIEAARLVDLLIPPLAIFRLLIN